MIKLLASDLDGTLLDEDHVLSTVVKEAVSRLRASGVHFLPTSGRDYISLMHAIKKLDERPKCICLNGAEFFDNDGKMLGSIPIPKDVLYKTNEVLLKYVNLEEIEYISENKRYVNIPNILGDEIIEKRIKRMKTYGKQVDELDEMFQLFKKLTVYEPDMEKLFEQEVMKVEVAFTDSALRTKVLEALSEISEIIVTAASEFNLEINDANATKGNMVAKVAALNGYEEDEVVVVGDGANDIPMLSRFKNSYAMGQAPDYVKAVANFEALSNVEDGVAVLIDQIIEANKQEAKRK